MGCQAMSERIDQLKQRPEQGGEDKISALVELSETLHANPEIGWQEHRAVQWVSDVLAAEGFTITPEYLGFETSFLAEYGSGSTKVGFMAEYDALPGLGHACGHNIIASSSVGAAIGLAPLADVLDVRHRVGGAAAGAGGGRSADSWRSGSAA